MVIFRIGSEVLRLILVVGVALTLIAGGIAPVAHAVGPNNEATRFVPRPLTSDTYEVGTPESKYVEAPDGERIFVEVTRPVARPNGPPPPARVPVILVMSPYSWDPNEVNTYRTLVRDFFVPKGYAYAYGHVYGTGNSGGCIDLFGQQEVGATSSVIEHLGTAPWSNGRIGMTGGSYNAAQALHAAARASEEAKRYLKAVASESGLVSAMDWFGHDGVPYAASASLSWVAYAPFSNLPPAEGADPSSDPGEVVTRQASACRAEHLPAVAEYELTGDYSPWIAQRSARPGAPTVTAATLMFQGFHDSNNFPHNPIGFFDRIPESTPHKLVMGQWGHVGSPVNRGDWNAMIHAWFDRWLMDLSTEVESWPRVQVEDIEGRWRAEPDWPDTRGRVGQLALNSDGSLGATMPEGSTSFTELGPIAVASRSTLTAASFSTGPLAAPLRMTGQPVLDLWMKLDRDDAHIAASLEVYGPDGSRLTSQGGPIGPDGQVGHDANGRLEIFGLRSVQHLEPIRNGEFRQTRGLPVKPGTSVHVPIRFAIPVDVVVPEGGWLTLRVGGTLAPGFPSTPSGKAATVELLHDCEHPSVLRFLMPEKHAEFLAVNDLTPPTQSLTEPTKIDGDIAQQRVCGRKPVDPASVLVR